MEKVEKVEKVEARHPRQRQANNINNNNNNNNNNTTHPPTSTRPLTRIDLNVVRRGHGGHLHHLAGRRLEGPVLQLHTLHTRAKDIPQEGHHARLLSRAGGPVEQHVGQVAGLGLWGWRGRAWQ